MQLQHAMNQCKERGTITRVQFREILLELPDTLGHMHESKRNVFMIRVEQLEPSNEDYDSWKAPV